MFLKCTERRKDGKVHRYWSVVENRRLSSGRIAQRHVLYLGEINDTQQQAWRKTVDVFDEGKRRQVALFPHDREPLRDTHVVGVRLNELTVQHPRQWGACWLADGLWRQLQLDQFWGERLPLRECPRAASSQVGSKCFGRGCEKPGCLAAPD